jgi:hypothetical protein
MAGQWPDCPDTQRAKIRNINLALSDEVNPCELAQQYGVPLSQLWAYTVYDGQTGHYLNDFMIARSAKAARRKSAGVILNR